MILEFKLQSTRDTIRVSAPQVDFQHALRDLVGIHKKTRQIVSIGDTAAEMEATAPEYWARNKDDIEFVRPFDFVTHAREGDFEPLLAARLVQYFSDKAFARIDRRSLGRLLTSPWIDRVDYALQLEGFMELPAQKRRDFVKHLKKLLVAPKRLSINGEVVWSK